MKPLSEHVPSDPDVSRREQSVTNRETWVRARELVTGEHDAHVANREGQVSERETVVQLREQSVRSRVLLDAATEEGARLLAQLRASNEHLVLATLRADETAEAEILARATAERHIEELEHRIRELTQTIKDLTPA